MRRTYRLKLAVISLTLAAVACVIFTGNAANPSARAFSQGPPAGHTSAPGEFNCSECHVTSEPGTGKLIVEAPTHYAPGQTYQLKVRQTNTDLTRLRWGFQLTALDSDNQKAGLLASTDSFTQVLDNQGPFPNRQYVEHTEAGTFEGQQGGATWTFNWTAPASDVGPVAFYAAGNQANGDRNTSGDHVYFTFVVSVPGEPAPDFAVSISPASRTVTPGGVAVYNVTVAPSGGFNGQVTLSAANQPAGASAVFDPPTLNFNDSSAQTSTLTVTTGAGTPAGNHQFTVNATGGSLARSANATLRVVSAASADLSVAKTASPNPVALGGVITYRITVVNHGPAQATGVALTDPLPLPLVPGSVTTTQGSCSGTTTVNCQLGTLAAGASAVVQINVNAQTAGLSSNVADVRADQSDFDASNNSATAAVNVEESSSGPRMTVPDLGVRTVVTGLDQPTTMAFIGPNEFLILEKASGRVRRVREGALLPDALDLAVNNASERGLLGIALHSNFTSNRFVYLYWTWRGAGDGANQLLGADTGDVSAVPLLGNRVDRFTWDGSKLTFDRNIISLRALQTDAGQPARGNHNGGVLRFEAGDQKLYVLVGDVGRRGLLQNVTTGLGPGGADDEFGGPEP
ncbi:MAG TPA: choice-of-anchor V domain-containing protein, partial [Pyrinomonadaceae bacterium]|nr:choice-of-anchor V domain-containing protein [Pyrinomonadaceae bacterium]